jgi:hypothetical protein
MVPSSVLLAKQRNILLSTAFNNVVTVIFRPRSPSHFSINIARLTLGRQVCANQHSRPNVIWIEWIEFGV